MSPPPLKAFFERSQTSAANYDRVALYAPDARAHGDAARAAGIGKDQLVAPLFGLLGNAGTAFAPLLLVSALESAKAGERILVVNFGNGADATSFRTTPRSAPDREARRAGAASKWNLARRRVVARYDDYINARGLQAKEWEAGTNPGLSATILFRERDDDLSFLGQQCRKCQAIQFPAQRVCETCFAKDAFDKVRLSDRIGKVVTYTFDFFFPTPNPPTIVTIVDVDGARIHLQVVELEPDEMKIGQESSSCSGASTSRGAGPTTTGRASRSRPSADGPSTPRNPSNLLEPERRADEVRQPARTQTWRTKKRFATRSPSSASGAVSSARTGTSRRPT